MAYLVTLALLIIYIFIHFLIILFQNRKTNKQWLYATPSGVSDLRVKEAGLDKISEDASFILDLAKLSFEENKKGDENIEYRGEANTDWVIRLILPAGGEFHKKDLLKIEDEKWRQTFSAGIFGHPLGGVKWTYFSEHAETSVFDEIEIGVNLLGLFDRNTINIDEKKLAHFLNDLEKRVLTYPGKPKLVPTESIPQIVDKAKNIIEEYNEFNKEVVIVLKSVNQYHILQVWDVLQSVGLKWGNMDLFHWRNPDLDYGNEAHFSVSTNTAPGYFIPENVSQGQLFVGDLIFEFSVPQSADPLNVFDAMLMAVRYCHKKIGGRILDKDGKIFDGRAERTALVSLVEKMKMKGVIPGSRQAGKIY